MIAVEGTHASGKTTLVHALTSTLREHGINAACTGEPARSSPFIEDIVIHGRGGFDLAAEVDLFGAQLTTQLRAARHHTVLITDKTLFNVVAYARLLLPAADRPAVEAMTTLCMALAGWYDSVLYCSDIFDPRQPGDDFRVKVADRQRDVDQALCDLLRLAGSPLTEIPAALSTSDRVQWILTRLAEDGLLTALS
ncbi:AAA family ATPase [Spongiactinospora rosea]|uniref:AAA family ATPase n=1 Tax=Spongiactinospora rosea TaxID=2248750 RepID=UPI0018F5B7B1|nr:AAA family ATPase [Spongiactinospora rosea]